MIEVYRRRIAENQVKFDHDSKLLSSLSLVRLIVFVGAISCILIIASNRLASLLVFVVPVSAFAFGLAVKRYNQAARELRHVTLLRQINAQEISRLENKLADFPSGQAFIKREHPYIADVDIFGTHSLFQLLNRTTTEAGQIRLAEWLAEPTSKQIILMRQQSIQELTPKMDWRQDLQAAGMPFINPKSSYDKLLKWNKEPVKLLPQRHKYLLISVVLGFLALAAFAFFIHHLSEVLSNEKQFSIFSIFPLLVSLTVNGLVLKRLKKTSQEIVEHLLHNVPVLAGYEALINKIEAETFHSEMLTNLQAVFRSNDYSAAAEIRKLKRILELLMQRGGKGPIGGNAFYAIFNQFFLLDIYFGLLTESWKTNNKANLVNWVSAISDFEAISSLSGFACSNPSYQFPEINDVPYQIHFAQLGHPLIHSEKRVCNDFQLAGDGSIMMITGSNMAGKSTFLRTIGVNMVLAFMGAPCCMTSGSVSPVRLFTSMRTQDNLEEGVSSFYAELLRIEQLLKLVESGKPVFFLLDEMFKGTNSQDRYKGGISLIRQLSELHASGIVSTHDLELARATSEHLPVRNFSFNSQVTGREMHFDYKLTEGLCLDFNASELMRKSGIKLI
ncbi:MutS-related protein [Dyadobacter sp. CY343]|uniref:MutS-related protein n=1 Tax=Dyadobacter sp. CY343 TaxID=2907299 RepID=UPI001F1AE341|nr:DNA mismatch repair protein MutS [Dyadobacter sp. CY343]MCE7062167.1 DNA mismatch repair protein MutS [Dyadobacter sp. CY343]